MAKFCSECGNKLIRNKNFCANCGASTTEKVEKSKNSNIDSTKNLIPDNVFLSVNLYWWGTAIGLFGLFDKIGIGPNVKMNSSLVIFTIALSLVITYFVTEQLKKGKNWLRILLTIGIIFLWFIVALDDTQHKLFNFFNYIDFLIKTISIGLLYTESSSNFFRKS
jgi:hypothetical protein